MIIFSRLISSICLCMGLFHFGSVCFLYCFTWAVFACHYLMWRFTVSSRDTSSFWETSCSSVAILSHTCFVWSWDNSCSLVASLVPMQNCAWVFSLVNNYNYQAYTIPACLWQFLVVLSINVHGRSHLNFVSEWSQLAWLLLVHVEQIALFDISGCSWIG